MKFDLLENKYLELKNILQGFESVAVAFSGGVDSTFLVHAAVESLGSSKVTAYFADSRLVAESARGNVLCIYERHFKDTVRFKRIELDPLSWKEFTANRKDRCYLCKKNIFSLFLREMQRSGEAVLLDGTNKDDLGCDRPGFSAIQELGVQSPLATAGLTKSDIRKLAKEAGLENYDLPSNSCLATRVATGAPLTVELLEVIDKAERFLSEKGFFGCRVRPLGERTIIEVMEKDVGKAVIFTSRKEICSYFNSLGLSGPALDLMGRKERLPKKHDSSPKSDINS